MGSDGFKKQAMKADDEQKPEPTDWDTCLWRSPLSWELWFQSERFIGYTHAS